MIMPDFLRLSPLHYSCASRNYKTASLVNALVDGPDIIMGFEEDLHEYPHTALWLVPIGMTLKGLLVSYMSSVTQLVLLSVVIN